jgi:hypothetical protein
MNNMPIDLRRRRLSTAGLSFLFLSACEAKPMTVNLDVVLFSYLDRPIFDVYLNRTDIGVAGPWPYSGRGTMTGVQIPLGPQKISWRLDGPKGTPGNGETVTAKNLPDLKEVPGNSVFLGVHIYADGTVELIPSEHFPDVSARGQEFDTQWKQRHGQ